MSPNISSIQQYVLAASYVLAVVLFSQAALDDFQIVKATAVVVGAAIVLALHLWRAGRHGVLVLPSRHVALAVGIFLVALVASTVASDVATLSLAGPIERYNGLLLYASGAVLLMAVTAAFEPPDLVLLTRSVAVTGAVVALYAVGQRVGLDPFGWGSDFYGDASFATLGNPNFAAAFLGVVTPLIAFEALRTESGVRLRLAAAIGTLVVLAGVWTTSTAQGPLVAAAGLSVLGVAWSRLRGGALGRVAAWAWLSFAGLAALAGSLALLGVGPLARVASSGTLGLRQVYWLAAGRMFSDSPVVGVGLGRYAAHYREYRPLEAALGVDLTQTTDAPHNVILGMLAEGGLVLGTAYLAVVVLIVVSAVRGFRRLDGQSLLLHGAFSGAWLGYLVQSFISIDVPALLVTFWIIGGAILVSGGMAGRSESHLSWQRPGAKRPVPAGRVPIQGWVLATAGIVLFLAALVYGTRPLRADLAAGRGQSLAAAGQHGEAMTALNRAVELASWHPGYWYELGTVQAQAGLNEPALNSFLRASEEDPRAFAAVFTSARVAALLGNFAIAETYFERALQLEPHLPSVKVQAAEYFVTRGQDGRARGLLEAALEVAPGDPDARQLLDQLGASG